MSDLDILGLVGRVVPQGPAVEGDAAVLTVATVYALDATASLVQVAVRDLAAMWVPAQPGRYLVGAGARVLLNSTTGRPVLVIGPVETRDPVVPGALTAINTGTHRATVTVEGVSYSLPYQASTYTVGTPVWVGLNDWGVPFLVSGSSDETPPAAPTVPAPPTAPSSIQVSQSIGPQWSGSYRSGSGWDRWNTGRYGGRSTLYQGNGYGSGPMTGLAVYGDQLANLGATSIDRVQVMLRGVDLSGASGPATVQGSPDGSQPGGSPSSSGDTAAGEGWVDLSSAVCEAMRTGAVKGLCTVGANYWAVAGAGNGDGMVLQVTYTRPA